MCALADNIDLAIPAAQTEKIIPVTRMQNAVVEAENGETFISLPVLFKMENAIAPHGLVLKPDCAANTTLLMPKIEKDIEIPAEGVHQLPGAFAGLFRYFKGAYINDQTVVLILDSEKLVAGVR